MLRRSNPPGPLGPTTAHLPASTCMHDTLTFRVFLLSVATSAWVMALEAFKKIQHRQTCTPGVFDCAPGISSLFSARAPMLRPLVTGYLWSAERKVLTSMDRDSMGYVDMDKRG